MYYSTSYLSPLGKITLSCDEAGEYLTGLRTEGQHPVAGTIQKDGIAVFAAAKSWLDRYFSGKKPDISELSLAPGGNEFRRTVWSLLCKIPYGETVTYGDIAKKTATLLHREKMSAQAVGGAIGHNPIPIIIPCHRVVGANGSLTGYTGGIDIKIKLLETEGADMSHLFVP